MFAVDSLHGGVHIAWTVHDDGFCEIIAPILPPPPKRPFCYPGRKRMDNRKALTSIFFVLRTGVHWEDLPQENGRGCGMTCWRRLKQWQETGVWKQLHKILLDLLNEADMTDWKRAVIEGSSVHAVFAGPQLAPIRQATARPAASITCSRAGRAFPSRAHSLARIRIM